MFNTSNIERCLFKNFTTCNQTRTQFLWVQVGRPKLCWIFPPTLRARPQLCYAVQQLLVAIRTARYLSAAHGAACLLVHKTAHPVHQMLPCSFPSLESWCNATRFLLFPWRCNTPASWNFREASIWRRKKIGAPVLFYYYLLRLIDLKDQYSS